MREIKFRGKRVDNEKWVYGDLIQHRDGKVSISPNSCRYGYGAVEGFYSVVNPKTIGQFIGLKDNGGRECFIGDFFKDKNGVCYRISKDYVGWLFIDGDVGYRANKFFTPIPGHIDGEVIGNLYETLQGGGE